MALPDGQNSKVFDDMQSFRHNSTTWQTDGRTDAQNLISLSRDKSYIQSFGVFFFLLSSQCSTLVRTLLLGRCAKSMGGSFSAPGAPKPLNWFTWHLVRLITSTVRPHIQNMVAAKNGGWGGHMGEVVPLRAFLLFLIPSTRPQLTLRSVDFRSVHGKTCFSGGLFIWGRFDQGVKSSFFTPKTMFQWVE